MSDKKDRIGLIGTGMMGRPMARRIAEAGYPIFVGDADMGRAAEVAAEIHGKVIDDAVLAELDVLITMLPNSNIVEEVVLGANGLASKLKKGTCIIDMSSSEPARSRDLGKVLQERGLSYLDAPVSGGVVRAEKGTLAILVGGAAETFERHKALLGAMGTSLIHTGEAGSGHAAKSLNNFVSAAALVATCEALHVAERFGISTAVMTDVLNASSGRTNSSENKVKQFMLNGKFNSGFALKLMDKDLKIAAALAKTVGLRLPIGELNGRLWDAAAQKSMAATDHTEMYKLIEDLRDM